MSSTFKTILASIIFTIMIPRHIKAQPSKGDFISGSIGLGFSSSYEEEDISGSGFYAQAEYVKAYTKWFGVRPYAGLILTSEDDDIEQNEFGYKVASKAFLLGAKVRISAPIPWVAPYFEIGLGTSIGSFETFTPSTNLKKNGLLLHVPFSIGLALGRKHNFEVAFTYYNHPSIKQFSGAAALGFSFPINDQ